MCFTHDILKGEKIMSKKLLEVKYESHEKYTEDDYDDMLNETYGTVDICGYTYDSAYALKELDPTAYNCGFADYQEEEDVYICPICGEEYDDEDDALYCCQDEDDDDEDEEDEDE
jgi:hypothetical protein